MEKENDFFNVVELTREFHAERRDIHSSANRTPQEFNRWYMEWMIQTQLGTLQQLTVISKHLGDLCKAVVGNIKKGES